MKPRHREALIDPLVDQNPITFHMLGLCSALAVTTSASASLLMGIALTTVLAFGSALISAIRHLIPDSVRLVIQMTIIASLVIVVDQVLKAYAFELSRQLTVFVGLIVTNCIVLGRMETFAMKHGVVDSFLDGIGNGAGYTAVLLIIATVRELLGTGNLFGVPILPAVADGGWYQPNGLIMLPPGVFFVVAGLIWAMRSWRVEQVEQAEFRIRHVHRDGAAA